MDMQRDARSADCSHARGSLMYTAPPGLPKDIHQKKAAGE
jgi:hypothetical protein